MSLPAKIGQLTALQTLDLKELLAAGVVAGRNRAAHRPPDPESLATAGRLVHRCRLRLDSSHPFETLKLKAPATILMHRCRSRLDSSSSLRDPGSPVLL